MIQEDHIGETVTEKGTVSSPHTPKRAGNISRLWAEERLQMLPDFITTPKTKAASKPYVGYFPVLQLTVLDFLRTGTAHAVLYILSEGEVKEEGGQGTKFSEVQG